MLEEHAIRAHHIRINAGVRRAYERWKDVPFSFALDRGVFIRLIASELPEYMVHSNVMYDIVTLRLWGHGLDEANRFRIDVPVFDGSNIESWMARLEAILDATDVHDFDERARAETDLWPQFDAIERDIVALREKAKALIADLPVPSSAKFRSNPTLWTHPSIDTAKRYPIAFPRTKEE